MTSERRVWRWTNFPVPEAHLIVGAVGVVLGLIWPLTLGLSRPWSWLTGIVLIITGVVLMAWATSAAGSVLLADPDQLVTDGPYRFSRNPMYLGWTLVYVALMIVSNSLWLLILLPVLAAWIHWETMREEKRMIERFGERYIDYQSRVRRYL